MRNCRNCSYTNPDENLYCDRCGCRLSVNADDNEHIVEKSKDEENAETTRFKTNMGGTRHIFGQENSDAGDIQKHVSDCGLGDSGDKTSGSTEAQDDRADNLCSDENRSHAAFRETMGNKKHATDSIPQKENNKREYAFSGRMGKIEFGNSRTDDKKGNNEFASFNRNFRRRMHDSRPPHYPGKWICSSLCILLIIIAASFPCYYLYREQNISRVRNSMSLLNEYANTFTDENGFVLQKDAEYVIDAVYTQALLMPGVTSCEKDEYGVFISTKAGLDYVYLPPIEGIDSTGTSLNIITLQPYSTENKQINIEHSFSFDLDAPDICAQETSAADLRWTYSAADDVNDENVTLDRILHLNDYKLILWQGHGGYTRRSGYFLCTTIPAADNLFREYKCLTRENAVLLLNGTLGLKPSFFDECFGENAFDNAFIYFATCFSGKEESFASVFVKKGAAVVFVNSESINRGYNLDMLRMIVESFFVGIDAPVVQNALLKLGSRYSFNSPGNWTISDCLLFARLYYGEKDPNSFFNAAKVYYVGNRNVDNLTYYQWMSAFAAVDNGQSNETASPSPENVPTERPIKENDTHEGRQQSILPDGEYYGLLTSWSQNNMTVELLDYYGRHEQSYNYWLEPTGQILTLDISQAIIRLEWAWNNGQEIQCKTIDEALSTKIWEGQSTLREACSMEIRFLVKNSLVNDIVFLYAA